MGSLPPFLPPSPLPLSIWNASRTTMKSLHVIKSAVPSPGTQKTALTFTAFVTRRVEWFLHPIQQQIA